MAEAIPTTRGLQRNPETAVRDQEAARLRSTGMTYQQIADKLEVSKPAAYKMVMRAIADVDKEPAEAAIAFELENLDRAERLVLALLERKHFVVSTGKLIYMGDKPMEDDGYVLPAVDRLVKISESRRKLLGLDSVQKIDVSGGFVTQVIGLEGLT
jgi:hypothetical protein